MRLAAAEATDRADYGRFPERIERDWLGRWCHLSEADVALARRRAGDVTRLGFAAQLVTVRAIGTFLADPAAVPDPIVASVARQLDIADPGLLAGYAKAPVRWKHTAEIRRRYGYRDFTSEPAHIGLLRHLYRQAWADDLGPTALFRVAHRRLLDERVILPGENVLTRTVASVRERATQRLWAQLARSASPELVQRLEDLLVVPEGKRRSELDRLRRPPFSPTITGLVQSLERLGEVRALGVEAIDLSALPPRRVAGLARYAEDAWVTQLADLASQRRVATLVAYAHGLRASARDDVIDIFDVVFGDMQRAATNRGKKRRAGELKEYDRAVAELHARMQAVLDALDDEEAIAVVLGALREDRDGIVGAMGTVTALMRPPADPYHERLVACYPQIRRFLPMLIEALAMESTAPARPVLEAFGALGAWLAEKPHTGRLPGTDVPLDVVSTSWEPHVRDRDDGSVNRAAYPAACSTASESGCAGGTCTHREASAGAIPGPSCSRRRPGTPSATRRVRPWPSTPTRPRSWPSWARFSTRPGAERRTGLTPIRISASSTATAPTGSWSAPSTPWRSRRRWSACGPWSRCCSPRSRSPTYPSKCTAGPASSTSTATSAARAPGPPA